MPKGAVKKHPRLTGLANLGYLGLLFTAPFEVNLMLQAANRKDVAILKARANPCV